MDSMLDEITKNAPDGKVVERNEFQKACDAFVVANGHFAKLDFAVRTHASACADGWFAALKQKYLTEERVWELFCSGFESTQMTRFYLDFRNSLLRREPMRPNA